MNIQGGLSVFARLRVFGVLAGAALLTSISAAQEPGTDASPEPRQGTNRVYEPHAADGQRHGLPVETYAVVPGTRFMVSLEKDLNSKNARRNEEFRVRTLEPLEAGQ